MRFYPFTFTGNGPRKGWRTPLNQIICSEQRDALRLNPQSGGLRGARLTSPQDLLTGYGYLPRQARQAHHGARYMDHELMTMWLSVDPLADKYPSISPYAYCAWNPVKLIDPDGCEIGDYFDKNGNHLGTDNKKDAKIFILKEGKSISEKDDFNKDKTREKFTEVEKSSNLYALISAVYAEMGGADKDSKQIVAESIYNRANLPGKKYEKADGTYKGVIKKAYDVANPKNKRFDYYINPHNHIYSNP